MSMKKPVIIALMAALLLVGASIIGAHNHSVAARVAGLILIALGALIGTVPAGMRYSRRGGFGILLFFAVMGMSMTTMKAGAVVVIAGVLLLLYGVIVAAASNRCRDCGQAIPLSDNRGRGLHYCPHCGAQIGW